MTDLHQDIVSLHNIARNIEQNLGAGKLSEDIRRAADRLNTLISKTSTPSLKRGK